MRRRYVQCCSVIMHANVRRARHGRFREADRIARVVDFDSGGRVPGKYCRSVGKTIL